MRAQPQRMNSHPNNLIPRFIKKPAAVRAHPYSNIQKGGSPAVWRKSQVGHTNASNPAIEPTNRAGSKAWAMRRVGGDQKGSDSFSACRRTKTNDPAKAVIPTPAQTPINP